MQKTSFKKLLFPILVELLLTILIGAVDTFMLSAVGDTLVGAVGTANSYIHLFLILFSVISAGLVAVMTQYIGAGKIASANRAHLLALVINGCFGVLLALMFFFLAEPILTALKVAPALLPFAVRYMKILGSCVVIDAVSPLFSAYLKAYGRTKFPMISTTCANILNVGLNALFIYTRKSDITAMTGVAVASAVAKFLALSMNIIFFFVHKQRAEVPQELSDRQILHDIVKIGLPSALESIIYNACMAVVTYCLNFMDDDGTNMTIYSYCSQIANFAYITGAGMAQANAIIVGWKIGEGKLDECYKMTFNVLKYAIIISVVMASVLAALGGFILALFTDDPNIIAVGTIVLCWNILLEVGRATNLTLGHALKTSGDATFTVIIGVVFMATFAALGSYIAGNVLKFMVCGVWVAKALDEVGRGILMTFRWKSKRWQSKVLVKQTRCGNIY